jgi:hypothetical protein
MKKLLITLLLISPFSFADWGDVYYCQMTTFLDVSLEGEKTNYKLEKFKFKLDKTKNAMVFGKQGYFEHVESELIKDSNWPSLEIWHAENKYSRLYFKKGRFVYALVGITEVTSISADCENFQMTD